MKKFQYYKKEDKELLGIAMGWDDDIYFATDFKSQYCSYKEIQLEEFRDICYKYNCLQRDNIEWFQPTCISY